MPRIALKNFIQTLAIVSAALFLSACNPIEIVTTDNESEANEMIFTLKDGGILANKVLVNTGEKTVIKLTVDDGLFSTSAASEAMRILRQNCLPYTPPPEVKSESFVGSGQGDRLRQQRQDQINIEMALRDIAGVTCVKCALTYPQPDFESYKPYPSTASVVLSYVTEQPTFDKAQVQNIVARSIPKLDPANVEVKMQYVPIPEASLDTRQSWVKTGITAGIAASLIGVVMIALLWFRSRGKNNEEEFDEDDLLLDENELLLEPGEEEEV